MVGLTIGNDRVRRDSVIDVVRKLDESRNSKFSEDCHSCKEGNIVLDGNVDTKVDVTIIDKE